jgi:hypothetical protein
VQTFAVPASALASEPPPPSTDPPSRSGVTEELELHPARPAVAAPPTLTTRTSKLQAEKRVTRSMWHTLHDRLAARQMTATLLAPFSRRRHAHAQLFSDRRGSCPRYVRRPAPAAPCWIRRAGLGSCETLPPSSPGESRPQPERVRWSSREPPQRSRGLRAWWGGHRHRRVRSRSSYRSYPRSSWRCSWPAIALWAQRRRWRARLVAVAVEPALLREGGPRARCRHCRASARADACIRNASIPMTW